MTVARLGEEDFQLGVNSNVDFDYLRVEARKQSAADPAQWVHVTGHHRQHLLHRPVGPLAREVIGKVSTDDLTNDGLKYFRTKEISVGGIPVTAMRLSYVGELGWELYTTAEYGLSSGTCSSRRAGSTASSLPAAAPSTACAWRRATGSGART